MIAFRANAGWICRGEDLMQPTVFAIGVPLPSVERFTVLEMESNVSWLDADIIVVEPHISGFETEKAIDGHPLMKSTSSTRYRNFKERWKQQIDTALNHGKLVVFLMPEVETRVFFSQAGTSKTEITTNYGLSGIFVRDPSHVKGRQMKLTGDAKVLNEYWKAMGSKSQYQCLFSYVNAIPLITTASGSKMCGCRVPTRGELFVLPSIDWTRIEDLEVQSDPDKEGFNYKVGQVSMAKQLRQALSYLYKNLTEREPAVEVPEWALTLENRVGRESVILDELAVLRADLVRLASKEAELETELAGEQSLKNLLFGSGKSLEEAVRSALNLLGFASENYVSAQSEFDIVFTSAEGRFIGEVEGRDTKPIAVEKAGQLHRNITEDFARDEVTEMAKGVLFGNAFRNQPVEDRTEVFTDKVVTFSKTANMALVRTSDLFRAVQHFLATQDADFATACRQTLANSGGSIVTFPISQS